MTKMCTLLSIIKNFPVEKHYISAKKLTEYTIIAGLNANTH